MDTTVIVPVYNEEEVLEETVARIAADAASAAEIIIVDGGSTDGTGRVARRLAEGATVRYIDTAARCYKGESIETGIQEAAHPRVAFVDADLPVPAEDIDRLASVLERVPLALGSRYCRGSEAGRAVRREIPSRTYNWVVRRLFSTGVDDHQCGCKAFRRDEVLELLPAVTARHWFWDTELIIEARRRGLAMEEVPVQWRNRGASSLALHRAVPHFLRELVRVYGSR